MRFLKIHSVFIAGVWSTLLFMATPMNVDAKEMSDHPFVFHLVQASLWNKADESGEAYFPPTYSQDGFTHGTSNPEKLLTVANHFYQEVTGDWYCLRMTTESLAKAGVSVVYESTAPVGDKEPDFAGSEDELYPHIMGGIHPSAVLEVHPVGRDGDGEFLWIKGISE